MCHNPSGSAPGAAVRRVTTARPMRINVSKESEVSLRDQIAVQVEFLIATRKLEAAESLPSVRALATRLKINHNTVSQAYRDLVEKGLLVRRRGSRLVVRSPEEPLTPTPAKDLDNLINGTVRAARKHGYTMQQLRHRLRTRLLIEPPDHILALSIDVGMRALSRLELTESLHCPVETCPPEKLVENPGLAIGALVLSPPGLMPQVVSVLPKDRPIVRITYSLADEHVASIRDLEDPSQIAVASISAYFLKTARGVLVPVIGRRHSLREYLVDGKLPRGLVRVCGWRNETSGESRATSSCRNSWRNSPSSTRRLRLRPGRRKPQPAESRSFQRKSGYPPAIVGFPPREQRRRIEPGSASIYPLPEGRAGS